MADLEIAWTVPALTNVTEALDFMAGFDAGAAERWYLAITRAVERAANFPRAGRVVSELSREDVREVIVGNHRVIYRGLPPPLPHLPTLS